MQTTIATTQYPNEGECAVNPEFRDFRAAYVEAIRFTEAEEIGDAELSREALARITADCETFWNDNCALIEDNPIQAGHDFWLTRNGHGAGFWDREEIWGKENAQSLTDAAHAAKECEVYTGDDGQIYFL